MFEVKSQRSRSQLAVDVAKACTSTLGRRGLYSSYQVWEPQLSNGRNIRIPLSRRDCAREVIILPAKAREYVFTGVNLCVCLSVCDHDN